MSTRRSSEAGEGTPEVQTRKVKQRTLKESEEDSANANQQPKKRVRFARYAKALDTDKDKDQQYTETLQPVHDTCHPTEPHELPKAESHDLPKAEPHDLPKARRHLTNDLKDVKIIIERLKNSHQMEIGGGGAGEGAPEVQYHENLGIRR